MNVSIIIIYLDTSILTKSIIGQGVVKINSGWNLGRRKLFLRACRVSCLFDRPVALGGVWERHFKFWRARARDFHVEPPAAARIGKGRAGKRRSTAKADRVRVTQRNYAQVRRGDGDERLRSIFICFVLLRVLALQIRGRGRLQVQIRRDRPPPGHVKLQLQGGTPALAPRFVELCSYYCLVVCPREPGKYDSTRCDR
jgi:hypothetical protein